MSLSRRGVCGSMCSSDVLKFCLQGCAVCAQKGVLFVHRRGKGAGCYGHLQLQGSAFHIECSPIVTTA